MDRGFGDDDDGSYIPKYDKEDVSYDESGDISKLASPNELHVYAINILKKKLDNQAHNWEKRTYGKYKLCLGHLMIQPTRFWWKMFMMATFVVGMTFLFEIEKYSFWNAVFGMLIFVLCIASTIETIFVDPGIIKRPRLEDALINLEIAEHLIMHGMFPPVMKIKVGEKLVLHGYCKKCHLFRPPFSGHCNTCDCCILDWNQHCDMTGTCIGKNNWIWSQIMGFSYTIFYIFMFISGVVAISSQSQENDTRPQFLLTGSIVVIEIILIIIVIFIVACSLYWIPETKDDRKSLRNYDRFPPLDVPSVQSSVFDFAPDYIPPFTYSEYGKKILERQCWSKTPIINRIYSDTEIV